MNRVTSLAVQYLKGKLGDMSDTYTLALIAYAFELADDSAKEIALGKLMKKVIKEGKFLYRLIQLTTSLLQVANRLVASWLKTC